MLKTRISNHKSNVNCALKLLSEGDDLNDQGIIRMRERSAFVDHYCVTKHEFNFEKAAILDSTRKTSNLNVLEMCHIVNTPHTVNIRTDTDGLSSTYAGILHTLQNTLQNTEQARHNSRQATITNSSTILEL